MDVLRAANKGYVFCGLLTESLLAIHENQNKEGELKAAQHRIQGETSSLPVWSFTRPSVLSDWAAHVWHHAWVCFWVERGDGNGSDGLNICDLMVSVAEHELIPGPERTWLRLHVSAASNTPAASTRDITGQVINQRLLTEKVINSIKGWVEDCERNHTGCKQHLSLRSVEKPRIYAATSSLRSNHPGGGVREFGPLAAHVT